MFHFENLDGLTRVYLLHEVNEAIKTSRLNFSKRFNDHGHHHYPHLLREAAAHGTAQTLADALTAHRCFITHERRADAMRPVPANAALLFAEREFNAFYMRGLCQRAIGAGCQVQVYRGKASAAPRPESVALEGTLHDPKRLLLFLRHSIDGTLTGLGLAGVSSGLSIRLPYRPEAGLDEGVG
ncbi:MAG: hypothetical protein ACRYFX_10275 [Janthinobacterium lividum]